MLASCKDSPTKPSGDMYGANTLAREGMQMLNSAILDLDDSEDMNDANDLMLQSTFNSIEGKFSAALALDGDNPMANLGMSILDIVRINYDQELWDMIDELSGSDTRSKRIINNNIQFLAETPKLIIKQLQPTRVNNISVQRMQSYIIDSVLPRLNQSLTRLNHAVALADSNAIMIDTGEEMMEVDCGEIYSFRAAVNMIYAAFNMLVAYDMDLKDAANSYGWITELNDIEVEYINDWDPYDYTLQYGHLILDYYDWDYAYDLADARRLELMSKTLKHNLDNNPSFGKLKSQSYLTHAKSGILAAAADVKSAVAYILDENDAQSNDVIKIENILSMNDDFSNIGPNDPNFMQNWTCIDDVADWLETIVTQSYALNENGVSFSVNLNAYFSGGIQDVRDILPYFQWNSNQSWIESSFYDYWSWDYDSYDFWMNDQYYHFEDLHTVTRRHKTVSARIGEFTDATGIAIMDDEIPYFPDYTFGGILPGMNRAKFIQLFE
jgi:hypothetical protein